MIRNLQFINCICGEHWYVVFRQVILRCQAMHMKVHYISEGQLLIAYWFVNVQDQLEQQALLVQQGRLVVLDSQDPLVHKDQLAALETLEILVSRVLLVFQVTLALVVTLDGRVRVDHKVTVARQVPMEIQDYQVSLDLPDCKDSRDLLVALVQQEVVETLAGLASQDLLVLPGHKVKLELLDKMDSLEQMVELASLELQVQAVDCSLLCVFIICE